MKLEGLETLKSDADDLTYRTGRLILFSDMGDITALFRKKRSREESSTSVNRDPAFCFLDLSEDKHVVRYVGYEKWMQNQQVCTKGRIAIHEQIKKLLSSLPQTGCGLDLVARILRYECQLGRGTFGYVCKVSFKDTSKCLSLFAVKTMVVNRNGNEVRENTKRCLEEIAASSAVSKLVLKGLCPNFAIQHYSTQGNNIPTNIFFADIFMEVGDGNVNNYLNDTKNLKASTILTMAFQAFASLVWMGRIFDMVHNDFYPDNLIYNIVPTDAVYRYVIHSHDYKPMVYDVRTEGFLIKAIDFSLATTDAKINGLNLPRHMDVVQKNPNPPKTFLDPDITGVGSKKSNHVTKYECINPFARDAWVLLSAIFNNTKLPQAARSWARRGMNVMTEKMEKNRTSNDDYDLRNTAFLKSKDLVDTMLTIFHRSIFETMSKNDNTMMEYPFSKTETDPVETFVLNE